MEKEVSTNVFQKGLQTDNHPAQQENGSYRFALNAIVDGDAQSIALANEQSNAAIQGLDLGENAVLLGSCYINNNETVLFVVNFDYNFTPSIATSKILLFNHDTENLTELVNDSTATDKLNFNEHHQIQATYRLRQGCNRILYFVDNYNVPRQYNIDKPYNYIDDNGNIVAAKFNLVRTYKKIPVFEREHLLENGTTEKRFGLLVENNGQLLPGSYNFSFRYLDSDFNATDWLTSTEPVIIYNEDPTDEEYHRVRGSNNVDNDFQKFGATNKSIKCSVRADSLDYNFAFVQYCMICSNSSNGAVNDVHLSPQIAIDDDINIQYYVYSFTGNPYLTTTVDELPYDTNIIERAKTIEQIDNRLVLGNTEGVQIDWCRLQKYASKIKVCGKWKKIELNKLSHKNNIAAPNYRNEDTGFMPGEIYSLGIVYVFEDGSKSPVYHIPGIDDGWHDENDPDTFALSNNNKCDNILYTNSDCYDDIDNYWGYGWNNTKLQGENVCHHRFPTRRELGEMLYSCEHIQIDGKTGCETADSDSYQLLILANKQWNWGKIISKYKREYDSFTINIYIKYKDKDNNERYDKIIHEIPIHEWEEARKDRSFAHKGRSGWYKVNLGQYPNMPEMVGITEEPVTYIRSDGDGGIRYGWMTTAGYVKCRYKFRNNEWENVDDDKDKYPSEDGGDIESFFTILPATTLSTTDSIYKLKPTKRNGAKGFFNSMIDVMLKFGEHDYGISVVNVYGQYNGKNDALAQSGRWSIVSNKDLKINCTPQIYHTRIMGLHFDKIELPDIENTNGHKCIGYYIVANERTDDEKTVLDSAVLLPMRLNHSNNIKYASYSYAVKAGQTNNYGSTFKDAYAFINPEFKYLKKKYNHFTFETEMNYVLANPWGFYNVYIRENEYVWNNKWINLLETFKGIISCARFARNGTSSYGAKDTDWITEDVQAGTSYDKKVHKKGEKDNDGFELYNVVREIPLETTMNAIAKKITPVQVEYLSPLEDTMVKTKNGKNVKIYNLSSDNAIGILANDKNNGDVNNEETAFPYGILKRELADPYGNFRLLPYYKLSKNLETEEKCDLWSGDTYISPMKYTNSVFYNTKIKKRRRKNGLWQIIVGATGAVAGIAGGIIGGIFTGGALAAVGFAAAAASISLMISGIKIRNANRIYNRLYNDGLKDTFEDNFTKQYLQKFNPQDDQIQWVTEIMNSLWFESTINQFWRVGVTGMTTDFLDPLAHYSHEDYNQYIIDKFTTTDVSNKDGKLYVGFAKSEYYEVNLDYLRKNKEKIFHALPFTYDCCSKCKEKFPQRVYYSEQAFQEEVTDNYSKFLPNNYRDIEGEHGVITNIFTYLGNLYIHTEETLWKLPRNYQERITGEIISFVGTGSFFNFPPQKILYDKVGISAGSKHQCATLITPAGVFFVDEHSRKIYLLQGESLVAVSDEHIGAWANDNLLIKHNIDFKKQQGYDYPYNDNPASFLGTGYIATFDKIYNRVLFTKIDKTANLNFPYFIYHNKIVRFYNENDTIIINELNRLNGLLPPDTPIDNYWKFFYIDTETGKAIFRRKKTGEVLSYNYAFVPAEGATSTISQKRIKFRFLDNLENENITEEQIDHFELTIPTTITFDYTCEGNTYTATDIPIGEDFELFDENISDRYSPASFEEFDDYFLILFKEYFLNCYLVSSYEVIDESCPCNFREDITVTVYLDLPPVSEPQLIPIEKYWYHYDLTEGIYSKITDEEELSELASLYSVKLIGFSGGEQKLVVGFPVEDSEGNLVWSTEITLEDNIDYIYEEIRRKEDGELEYGYYHELEKIDEEDGIRYVVHNKPKHCQDTPGGQPGEVDTFFNVAIRKVFSCGAAGGTASQQNINARLYFQCGDGEKIYLTPNIDMSSSPSYPNATMSDKSVYMSIRKTEIETIGENNQIDDLWETIINMNQNSECKLGLEEIDPPENCTLVHEQSVITVNASQPGIELMPLTFAFTLYNECECTEEVKIPIKICKEFYACLDDVYTKITDPEQLAQYNVIIKPLGNSKVLGEINLSNTGDWCTELEVSEVPVAFYETVNGTHLGFIQEIEEDEENEFIIKNYPVTCEYSTPETTAYSISKQVFICENGSLAAAPIYIDWDAELILFGASGYLGTIHLSNLNNVGSLNLTEAITRIVEVGFNLDGVDKFRNFTTTWERNGNSYVIINEEICEQNNEETINICKETYVFNPLENTWIKDQDTWYVDIDLMLADNSDLRIALNSENPCIKVDINSPLVEIIENSFSYDNGAIENSVFSADYYYDYMLGKYIIRNYEHSFINEFPIELPDYINPNEVYPVIINYNHSKSFKSVGFANEFQLLRTPRSGDCPCSEGSDWNIIKTPVHKTVEEYEYSKLDLPLEDVTFKNMGFTLSYNLDKRIWASFHSYLPNFYMHNTDTFYSHLSGMRQLFKHNIEGEYQRFYGTVFPHIIDYVNNSQGLRTANWDDIQLIIETSKYQSNTEDYIDVGNVFFDNLIVYNKNQISGLLDIVVLNNDADDWMVQQIKQLSPFQVFARNSEGTWSVNGFRDNRNDNQESMFTFNINDLQTEYFIDKIINQNAIDLDKDWKKNDTFAGKYIQARFIFLNRDSDGNALDYKIVSFISLDEYKTTDGR